MGYGAPLHVNIVVDIPDSLVERMRTAIEAGDYEDPGEFVRLAVENQIELEESGAKDAVPLEEALSTVGTETRPSPDSVPSDAGTSRADDSDAADERENRGEPEDSEITLDRRRYDSLPAVAPPDASRLDDGPLWGQYNRIFPVKLVVRGLANELDERADAAEVPWIELPPFRRRIARTAREIGTALAAADSKRGRSRGEKLSTGLPIGDDVEKSQERFRSHFVGRVESGEELTGAPPHLLMVDFEAGSPPRVGLTEAGKTFAGLSNPVLDGGVDADRSLSDDEREFYLDHVQESFEDEYEAMETVARAIVDGDDRPTTLTERVAYLDPEWSNSQADTIRSGLISRMHELGLVDRTRVGQRGIAYELTDAARREFKDVVAADDTDPTDTND